MEIGFVQKPHRDGGDAMRGAAVILAGLVLAATALIGQVPASAQDPLDRVNHIIVIYQENWSFDALYGKFPGANGLRMPIPLQSSRWIRIIDPIPRCPSPSIAGSRPPLWTHAFQLIFPMSRSTSRTSSSQRRFPAAPFMSSTASSTRSTGES